MRKRAGQWTVELEDPATQVRRTLIAPTRRALKQKIARQRAAWAARADARAAFAERRALRRRAAAEAARRDAQATAERGQLSGLLHRTVPQGGMSFLGWLGRLPRHALPLPPLPLAEPPPQQGSLARWWHRRHQRRLRLHTLRELRAQRALAFALHCEWRAELHELDVHARHGSAADAALLLLTVLRLLPLPPVLLDSLSIHIDKADATCLIEWQLPAPQDLPRADRIRFLPAEGRVDYTQLSPAQMQRLYDSFCFQLALACLYTVFALPGLTAIRSAALNGWRTALDPATGHSQRACILSLAAGRAEFSALLLTRVDPEICFRTLGGRAGPSPSAGEPVAPLVLRGDERDGERASDAA